MPTQLDHHPYPYEDEYGYEVGIGHGPIERTQPEWYATKFVDLQPWSSADVELLKLHLCGKVPYMSTFDLYRVSWESIRNPDLEVIQAIADIEKNAALPWMARKAVDAILNRSANMGPEVTQVVDDFKSTGVLSLPDFERACKTRFTKHAANRVRAVRSLLVGSGLAVETYSHDGSIVLRSGSINGETEQVGPEFLRLEIRKFDPSTASIQATRPANARGPKKDHSDGPVSLKPYEIRSGTSKWEILEAGIQVVGSYDRPSSSRAFGVTSIMEGENKYTLPGTVSGIYADPGSGLRVLISSRSISVVGNGEVLFAHDLNSRLPIDEYLKSSSGIQFDPREEHLRIVLESGGILRLTNDLAIIEAIQLSKSLCNALVEASINSSPSDAVNAYGPIRVRHDVLAQTPIDKRKGFFKSDVDNLRALSVRDIANLTPEQVAKLVSTSAKAKSLQEDVLYAIYSAFFPYSSEFGIRPYWAWSHSKISAELSQLRKKGWVITPDFYEERPEIQMQFDFSRTHESFTRVESMGSDDLGKPYLEIAGGIMVFEDATEKSIKLIVPDNSSKLEVLNADDFDLNADEFRGPPRYVDFDDYAFTPAECELMCGYVAVLATAGAA
tara:strand:+ start:354 stop:2192 length:1839 start_codon:yes stop_codon:yes gene_type:complete